MGLDPNNPNTAYAFAMANTQKLMDYAMSAGAHAQLPALINAAAATSMVSGDVLAFGTNLICGLGGSF
jgi:hypothetical protein